MSRINKSSLTMEIATKLLNENPSAFSHRMFSQKDGKVVAQLNMVRNNTSHFSMQCYDYPKQGCIVQFLPNDKKKAKFNAFFDTFPKTTKKYLFED